MSEHLQEAPGKALVETPPRSIWDRIRAEPERAPEHIALAAAERFADPARAWVAQWGPDADPRGLAIEARRIHVRLARLGGAALGLGGALTAPVDLASLVWIQSRMTFFIAASFGYDPGHPMRPAELLALHDLYATPAEARAALDGIGTHLAVQVVDRSLRSARDEQLTRKLMKFAGKRVARRYAAKAVPFIGSPIAAVQNSRATADLADRAIRYYGGEPYARP